MKLLAVPVRFVARQWKERPLVVFSLAFFSGILYCSHFFHESFTSFAISAIALFTLCLAKKWRKEWKLLALIVLAAGLGMLRFDLQTLFFPQVDSFYSIPFEGFVASEPFTNASGRLVFKFHVTQIDGQPARETVRLYLRSDELELTGIEYGQTLQCFGHIWAQDHATNPFQTDQADNLLGQGYQGMAAAKLEDVVILDKRTTPYSMVVYIRKKVSEHIDRLFPQSAGLAKAFIMGDRSELSEEVRNAFYSTGVAHLIAISGMHISVLAMMLELVLSHWLTKRQSSLMALAFITLYGAFVGFPASMLRAILMYAISTGAMLCGRPSDAPTRIAAALFIMLTAQPYYIYNTGFALSFGASAGIIFLKAPMDTLLRVDRISKLKAGTPNRTHILRRLLKYFPELISTSLAVTVATLPMIMAWFGAQPLSALPLNLIAIPLAMLAYPVSLIVLLISFVVFPIAHWLSSVPDILFLLLTRTVSLFSNLGVAVIHSPRYPAWLVCIHCCLVIAASAFTRLSHRVHRRLPIVTASLLLVSISAAYLHTLGFSMTFLDAGQADATVICTDGHVYVYDVGEPYTPIADYVSACCIQIDGVFLSHPHYDHAGGLVTLLQSMPPKQIFVPAGWAQVEMNETIEEGILLAKEMGIPIIECLAGYVLTLSANATATVWGPSDFPQDVNDLSIVLQIQSREKNLLLTGDLTAKGEPDHLPDIDILRVPHHGSKNATSEQLLEQTTPKIAVISVGENHYGHPSAELIERLQRQTSEIYRTDEYGAITIRVLANGDYRISTYLRREAENLESQ